MAEYIEIDGLKIYYQSAGNRNNPSLVFLPAWGAQVDWLPAVASEFSKHFYTIAIEHPGLMRSGTPVDGSFEARAIMLNSFLEKLELTTPVILVGNSFGGAVATAFALQYSQKVRVLILIDAALSNEFKVTLFVKVYHALYRSLISFRLVPSAIKRKLIKTYLGTPNLFLSKDEIRKKTNMLTPEHSLVADYRKLSMPTFLIWGTEDRLVHPIKYARKLAKQTPNVRMIEYKGSVPTIYKEPERIAPIILNALNINQ